MDAEVIARKAMAIAAEMCVYTNDAFTIEVIEKKTTESKKDDAASKATEK